MAKTTRRARIKGVVRDFMIVMRESNSEISHIIDIGCGMKRFQPSRELMEYGRAYSNLHPRLRKLALFISNWRLYGFRIRQKKEAA
jgi:hypothetical protein